MYTASTNTSRLDVDRLRIALAAKRPDPRSLDPSDSRITSRVYSPFAFEHPGGFADYEAARRYCVAQFGDRHSWRAFPAHGLAEFGFTCAVDAVQYALWAPRLVYPSPDEVSRFSR